jgi:hypothetical protein
MISIVKEAEKQRMSRGGKPSRLVVEDKLLMALEYLREYRTYFHLGKSYGLTESACYRNCKWVEDILIKSTNWARARAGARARNCGYARCLLNQCLW